MSTRPAHEQRLETPVGHHAPPHFSDGDSLARKNRAAGDWAKRLKHLNVGRKKPASLMAALSNASNRRAATRNLQPWRRFLLSPAPSGRATGGKRRRA